MAKKVIGIVAAFLAGLTAMGYVWYRHTYPYGMSHCCLKCLGVALESYAETHGGRFPAGGGSPEASLSLLYRWDPKWVDADILRGKTVPVETVQRILERGGLLGPDTCGWHYVEGLTVSDDSRLAIVWDKVGLDHNGRDLHGGHSVLRIDGLEEIIPASEWPQFLEEQEKLMAARAQKAKHPQDVNRPLF